MISDPRLLKAARILLGWSQEQLAEKAGIARTSLSKMEAGSLDVRVRTVRAVQAALEEGGVAFLSASEGFGEGLRLRSPRQHDGG